MILMDSLCISVRMLVSACLKRVYVRVWFWSETEKNDWEVLHLLEETSKTISVFLDMCSWKIPDFRCILIC